MKAYQEPILLTIYTVCGTKFLREFVFADWRFFCFAGTNFCDWDRLKYPVPSIDNIFVFIEYVKSHNMALELEMHILKQYYGVRQYFFVYRFFSERKRQVVREGTFFIGGVGRGFGGEGP